MIKYTDYNPENEVQGNPVSKLSKEYIDKTTGEKKPATQFHEIPIQYRYPIKDSEGKDTYTVAPLRVEGPVLRCIGGISEVKKHSGDGRVYYEATLFVSFDETEKSILDFVGRQPESFFSKLLSSRYDSVYKVRGQVGLGKINDRNMMPAIYSDVIYRRRNKETNNFEEGVKPVKFFKVLSYEWKGNTTRALFTSPLEEKPVVDWEDLKNVDVSFQPLLHFKKDHIGGGRVSLHFEIVSAVIVDILPIGTKSSQQSTIDLMKKDTAAIERLRANMALTRIARDKMKNSDIVTETTVNKSLVGMAESETPPPPTPPTPTPTPLSNLSSLGSANFDLSALLANGPRFSQNANSL